MIKERPSRESALYEALCARQESKAAIRRQRNAWSPAYWLGRVFRFCASIVAAMIDAFIDGFYENKT